MPTLLRIICLSLKQLSQICICTLCWSWWPMNSCHRKCWVLESIRMWYWFTKTLRESFYRVRITILLERSNRHWICCVWKRNYTTRIMEETWMKNNRVLFITFPRINSSWLLRFRFSAGMWSNNINLLKLPEKVHEWRLVGI